MIYIGREEVSSTGITWDGGVPSWFIRVFRVYPVTYKVLLPKYALAAYSASTPFTQIATVNAEQNLAHVYVASAETEVVVRGVSAITSGDTFLPAWDVDWQQMSLDHDYFTADWLTARRTGTRIHGSNNNYSGAVIYVQENQFAESREADINFRIYEEDPVGGWDGSSLVGEIYAKVNVSQAPARLYFSGTVGNLVFNSGATGGLTTYRVNFQGSQYPDNVYFNYTYHDGEPEPWLTFSNIRPCIYPSQYGHVGISASTNEFFYDRTATAYIQKSGRTLAVNIAQSAKTAVFDFVEGSTIYEIPRTGGTITVPVSTNMTDKSIWYFIKNANWFQVKPSTNGMSVVLSAGPYTTHGVHYGEVSATCTYNTGKTLDTVRFKQEYGSDFYSDNYDTVDITSATTSFTVWITSKYNGENVQPYFVSESEDEIGVNGNPSSGYNQGYDQYYFQFSCSANSDEEEKTTALYFRQGLNGALLEVTVTQAPAMVEESYITFGRGESAWARSITSAQTVSNSSTRFSVSSNTTWAVDASRTEDWISASKSGIYVNWTAASNSALTQRVGRIYVETTDGSNKEDWAQITQAAAAPRMTFTPSSYQNSVARTGGTGSISVDTNVPSNDWYADSDRVWLIASADGNVIRWEALENDSQAARSGSIEAHYEDLTLASITISQTYGWYLVIDPSTDQYVGSGSGYFTVTATSHNNGIASTPTCEIIPENEGLTYTMNHPSGSKDYVYTFSYTANPDSEEVRTWYLNFLNDGINTGFTVQQQEKYVAPELPYLYFTTPASKYREVNANGSSGNFGVSGNVSSWSTSADDNWVTVSKGTNRVNWTAATNTSAWNRSTAVRITGGGESDSVIIAQSGTTPVFYHSTAGITLPATGDTGSFSITGNNFSLDNVPSYYAFETNSSALWITAERNGNTVSWSAGTNPTQSERSTYIISRLTYYGTVIASDQTYVYQPANLTQTFYLEDILQTYPNNRQCASGAGTYSPIAYFVSGGSGTIRINVYSDNANPPYFETTGLYQSGLFMEYSTSGQTEYGGNHFYAIYNWTASTVGNSNMCQGLRMVNYTEQIMSVGGEQNTFQIIRTL